MPNLTATSPSPRQFPAEELSQSASAASPSMYSRISSSSTTIASNSTCNSVDKGLIRVLCALYFLGALSGSSWGRFSAIYFVNVQHLDPQQIGVIEGLMPFIQCVVQPLYGVLADASGRRKRIVMVTTILSSSLLMLFAWPSRIHGFGVVLGVSLGVALLSNASILDVIVLDVLGPVHRLRYGRLRLFAAIAWGLGNILMGVLTDRFGFNANFWWLGLTAVLFVALLGLGVPAQSKQEIAYQQAVQQQRAAEHMQEIDADTEVVTWFEAICFYVEVAVMGAGIAVVERMVFVFLQEPQFGINASTSLCGASVALSVVFELPVFYNAAPLMKYLGSNVLMMVSFAGMALRTFAFTAVTSDNVGVLLLAAESLHGLIFSCFWITTVDRAGAMMSGRWATTSQLVFQTAYNGVGVGIGAVAGGWVMQYCGPIALYGGVSIVMSCMAGIRLAATAARVARSRAEPLADYQILLDDEHQGVRDVAVRD